MNVQAAVEYVYDCLDKTTQLIKESKAKVDPKPPEDVKKVRMRLRSS